MIRCHFCKTAASSASTIEMYLFEVTALAREHDLPRLPNGEAQGYFYVCEEHLEDADDLGLRMVGPVGTSRAGYR